MTRIIKEVEDCKDIQITIKDSIVDLEHECKLCGWTRAAENEYYTKIRKQNNELMKENNKLKKENVQLVEQIRKLKDDDKLSKFKYQDINDMLNNKKLIIPGKYRDDNKEIETNYLKFIKVYKEKLITGLTNKYGMTDYNRYLYYDVCPFLISLGLLEVNKIADVQYIRIEMSKVGLEFVARIEMEELKKVLYRLIPKYYFKVICVKKLVIIMYKNMINDFH